jgi:hypothetical protein
MRQCAIQGIADAIRDPRSQRPTSDLNSVLVPELILLRSTAALITIRTLISWRRAYSRRHLSWNSINGRRYGTSSLSTPAAQPRFATFYVKCCRLVKLPQQPSQMRGKPRLSYFFCSSNNGPPFGQDNSRPPQLDSAPSRIRLHLEEPGTRGFRI